MISIATTQESDADLVRLVRNGDMHAFAMLAERYRASLRAVAITLIGYITDVDDVVQDAFITALRRLPELRDPDAVGPWLKAIVRNNCRSLQRARSPVLFAERESLPLRAFEAGPEDHLERAGTQDWVRHEVSALSAPVREVVLLRYFSGITTYRAIAELCGISVETVASRLRTGRRILATRLDEVTDGAFASSAELAGACREEASETVASIMAGTWGRIIDDWYHRDAHVVVGGKLAGGRSVLVDMMDWTRGAGVGVRLRDSAASKNLMVWEIDFVNPPFDPDHCPPSMACLLRIAEGRVSSMSIAYGTRSDD